MSSPNPADPTIFRQRAVIREEPFTSNVPILGPLIVALRTFWNNIAARWVVQSHFRQQTAFNLLLADYVLDNETRLIEQDRDQTELVRQVAELRLELARLRRRIGELESAQTASAE